ncbi:WAT1-related protein At4g08300-like [Impatiens glandulifera]|uniref:WAT1-related protein At4g08300-like n=1 Tax=Impatiens glandulifera TaxID=253017 RepID=UPI001FB11B07|nr:WAT1-related protein At4g08300-like [Impatiens glandulifera]
MVKQMFEKAKPYIAIILLQFGYAGMFVITMVSLKQGMSHYVLVVYRHLVATLAISPFALFIERKTRPKMTVSIFLKITALGLIEPVIDQNLYYVGMKYTSATFASAMVNILPALTFIMAVIFRLERVGLKQLHSIAKVVGTAITVVGAMVMTLYKGPIVNILGLSHQSAHDASNASNGSADHHWVMGTIMLFCCIVGWSSFFILQSITLKQYPAELSLTALICLMGTLQGSAVALAFEHDMSAWIIGFDSKLLAAVYSGVVCSGIAYYVQGVVNRARGPVFITAFSPLAMIITAILGALVLGEKVHLGSLIGAMVIVFGLYAVVWGKSKDPLPNLVQSSNHGHDGDKGKANNDNELPIVMSMDSNNLSKKSSVCDGYTFHGQVEINPNKDPTPINISVTKT